MIPALRATCAAALATVASLALLAGLPGHVPTARAADPAGPVRVTITGLSPVAPGPKSTIIVTGYLANTAMDEISAVSVRLAVSNSPLPSRRAIRQAVEGSADLSEYAISASETPVSNFLRAGGSRKFELRVKAADLLLPGPGVYALGVEVLGSGPAGYAVQGVAHTALPWVPDPVAAVQLAWLWPFATAPLQTANGVFLGDQLPRELQARGRLDTILDTAESATDLITWIVDPQLLQSTSDITAGYLVEKGGQIAPGTGQASARRWLERFQDAVSAQPKTRNEPARAQPTLWDLPYADIDADAVQRAGLDGDVVRAITGAPVLTRQFADRAADGTIYWAPGGQVSQGTMDLLASSGVTAVILRDTAVPPVPAVGFTASGYADLDTRFGTIRALLIDSSLLDALTMPAGNRSEIIAVRQRVLGELAFIALQSPSVTRHIVAAAGSTRWDPDPLMLRVLLTALRVAPWAKLTPAEEFLSLPPSTVPRTPTDYSTKARARELESAYMDQVKKAEQALASIRSVVVNPIAISEPISSALLRAESSTWRLRPRSGEALLATIERTIDARMTQLYVVPREDVIFSGDRGSVPVTVTNDFDSPVVVGVTLTGSPPARLTAEALQGVEIEAGRRASLEVPVRVVGSDPLTVTIQLVDSRGRAFGEPTELQLRTTAYSRAALWVVVGAAVLLALLVVFDIVRRARSRRAAHPGAT